MEIKLRVVLLGVGVLILLVVGYDFFKRKKEDGDKLEPNLGGSPNYTPQDKSTSYVDDYVEPDIYQKAAANLDLQIPENDTEIVMQPIQRYVDENEKSDDTQHIISITIMSREKYGFTGIELLNAIIGAEMVFGKGSIFHRFEYGETIFSLVNAMEPGYFIEETLPHEHIAGVSLIMLPENVEDAEFAFEKLIRTAKQIAFALNGELLDHFKLPLTLETIEQYRREVAAVVQRQ